MYSCLSPATHPPPWTRMADGNGPAPSGTCASSVSRTPLTSAYTTSLSSAARAWRDSNTMIGSTPETRPTLLNMRWFLIGFEPFLWPIEDWQIASPAAMPDEFLGEYPGEI